MLFLRKNQNSLPQLFLLFQSSGFFRNPWQLYKTPRMIVTVCTCVNQFRGTDLKGTRWIVCGAGGRNLQNRRNVLKRGESAMLLQSKPNSTHQISPRLSRHVVGQPFPASSSCFLLSHYSPNVQSDSLIFIHPGKAKVVIYHSTSWWRCVITEGQAV